MRILWDALSGRIASPAAPARLFGMFLATTFAVETVVMFVLPRVVPANLPGPLVALLDSTILTAVLAPVVWWVFLVPLRRLISDRGLLLERVLSSQELERGRIAKDLHDGLGQNLTSILLHLRVMEDTPAVDTVRDYLATVRRIATTSLADLRRMVRETRPPVLDDLGLAVALEKMLADLRTTGGIAATFSWHGGATGRLPADVETALYRVVQEAVTNAIKHSEADRLDVVVTNDVDAASVEIADNGKGFDVAGTLHGAERPFGLFGMRERVGAFGGTVDFSRTVGGGTTVHVHVPLAQGEARS